MTVCIVRLKARLRSSLSSSATRIGTSMPRIIFETAMNTVFQITCPMFGMENMYLKLSSPLKVWLKIKPFAGLYF